MTTKPVAYGYMRVRQDTRDTDLRAIEEKFKRYAERNGFELRAIVEEDDGVLKLDRFVHTVRQENVAHVLVASLDQISTQPAVQAVLVQLIQAAGAAVHTVRAEQADIANT
ncbi:recombinase family protein [Streptomyces sp. NPDC058459]|uniref:recombinase family protein n=1 Tax=Streptomyces sp. NPDC058459 TaxID=3346508 RepID=UPI00366074C7